MPFIPDQIPAVVRGQLARSVRHQGTLCRTHASDHLQEIIAGIAFDIQFPPVLLHHQGVQLLHVAIGGMALIRARVQGNAVGAQLQTTPGEPGNAGIIPPAGIPQQRNLVDVHR